MRTSTALRAAIASSILASACTPNGPPPACPKEAPTAAPAQPTAAPAPSPEVFHVLPEGASPVTFDKIAAYPAPGWSVPRGVSFTSDRKSVLYLASEDGSQEMALFAFDLDKKAPRLVARAKDLVKEDKPISREEELRRERARQLRTGITSYVQAKDTGAMVIPIGGDLFFRGADGKSVQLTKTAEPELDPKICKDGTKVLFVRGRELFAIDTAKGSETALTKGAVEGVTHGQSDFNGQEEFDEPSGYWLSPACDKVAYLEVDERPVGTVNILGFRDHKPDLMAQKYPQAGEKNPAVKIGVLDIKSKKTTWLKLPESPEHYQGRFAWSADGASLFFQTIGRRQNRLYLYRADVKTGAVAEIGNESSPAWLEFSDVKVLERSPSLLWTAVRDGHTHLELRDPSSNKVQKQLTRGAWDVTHIAAVDEDQKVAYFLATKESPLERHLYKVSLDGGEPVRLTPDHGVHNPSVTPGAAAFVDMHSARDRAPETTIRDMTGAPIGALPMTLDPDIEALKLRSPEIVTTRAASGDALHGALLKPRQMKAGEKHPVVVMVYGGPHGQSVFDSWDPRLLWQHLADRGFVVFQLDNRGTSGRGAAFEQALHGKVGVVELEDQLAGVAYLKTLPYVDASRIGIYGYSYGGFMAALAMLKAPGVFKVGIAGAPVTEWGLYDTGYTERYLDTPTSNQAGYNGCDLTKMAGGLQGKLLLMHGLMDENVHFQNTADLINALMAENKAFDLMVFPGERHGYRSPPSRKYANRKVVSYFVENL